jgi:hypothetical protein
MILSQFTSENQKDQATKIIQDHISKYKTLELQDNFSKGMIMNLEGQLTLALEKHKYF